MIAALAAVTCAALALTSWEMHRGMMSWTALAVSGFLTVATLASPLFLRRPKQDGVLRCASCRGTWHPGRHSCFLCGGTKTA